MKILVTGGNGQLGFEVVKKLRFLKKEHWGTGRRDFDINNEKQTKEFIYAKQPDIIIHCAAFTGVDRAEEEKELSYSTNVLGTRYLAQACLNLNAKMVYISTDYVFDGEKGSPYKTTDQPNPINFYGETKYQGELEVKKVLEKFFILRTSWFFGLHGDNFAKKIRALGRVQNEINVVEDQIGSPTYSSDLAQLIIGMMETEKYGIYHATNQEYCSRYDFAREIFSLGNIRCKVKPVNSDFFPTKAKRPKDSRLDNQKLLDNKIFLMRSYKKALEEFLGGISNLDF